MKVIIIGGGPAGMMSAITSAEMGNDVTILEKMESVGKKLLITGKGRCNITNDADIEEFYSNIPENSKFLYSSFNKYNNRDIVQFLNTYGVKTKVERGKRVFPSSDKARDVLEALMNKIKEVGVKIKYNFRVEKITTKDNMITGIEGTDVNTNKKEVIKADKVILATGGKSYPVTGSTGEGHEMARKLGHAVTNLRPSLVPLTCEERTSKEICQNLQGLSLRNVSIKIKNEEKTIYEDFGEMLFTHYGLSGPIILSASAILVRYKNIYNLLKENKIKISIDLKPSLTEKQLDSRILRDFEGVKNKQYKNSLEKLLPKKMINPIIKLSGINPEKKVNEIKKEERKNLVHLMKNVELKINGFRPIEEAIITSGGIDIKEIDPKTMESKIIKGLFFAGEIIDVDAYTGGFNLQIAWSTGYTAGANN